MKPTFASSSMANIGTVIMLSATLLSPLARAEDLFTMIESKPLTELWINPGFLSYHFNKDRGYNNDNYGLGAEYRFSTVASVTAGRYYNSDRWYTNYLGLYYQPFAIGPVRLGAVAGGFNGYPRMRDGGWFLAAIPMASYEYGRFGVNVAVAPSYKDRLHGVVALQLKLRIFD